MPNLILIDGPPGAGKSTIAAEVAELMPSSVLLHEMDPHHPLHAIPVSGMGADFSGLHSMDVTDLGNLLLVKWQGFLNDPRAQGRAFILESYPYQSHVRVLWQMNASHGYLVDWLAKLHEMLRPCDPVLAMLKVGDSQAHASAVFERRGPEWTDFIVKFAASTAYGKAHGLQGKAGALRFLEDYNAALVRWSDLWPYKRLTCEAWNASPKVQADAIVHARR